MAGKTFTRRDFLRGAAGAAVAAALGSEIPQEAQAEPTAKVVLIRNAEVPAQPEKMPEILQAMLDEAVKVLLGADDPLEAWRNLLKLDSAIRQFTPAIPLTEGFQSSCLNFSRNTEALRNHQSLVYLSTFSQLIPINLEF